MLHVRRGQKKVPHVRHDCFPRNARFCDVVSPITKKKPNLGRFPFVRTGLPELSDVVELVLPNARSGSVSSVKWKASFAFSKKVTLSTAVLPVAARLLPLLICFHEILKMYITDRTKVNEFSFHILSTDQNTIYQNVSNSLKCPCDKKNHFLFSFRF